MNNLQPLFDKRQHADEKAVAMLFERTGRKLNSIWDLVNTNEPYPELIPVLVELIDETFDDDGNILDAIIRALTVKEAKGVAAASIIRKFKLMSDDVRRWTAGAALSVVATSADFDEIQTLWGDPRYGKSREMLAVALAKSKDKRAFDALMQGLKDPVISGHAVWGLYLLGDRRAVRALEPYTKHEKAWVRKYAKKAVEKFGLS